MAKRRIVNTAFWDDSYIITLNPLQKLLFLYLLTNPLTNILGVYEISDKRISFDTGMNPETIAGIFKKFEADKRVYRAEGYVIIVNFTKHQEINPKVEQGIKREYSLLPKVIQKKIDYHSLSHLTKLNLTKPNLTKKFVPPSLQETKDYFKEKGYTEESAIKAWEYYNSADWHDSKGNKLRNWKQKMIAVWFKDENKIPVNSIKVSGQ